MRNLYYFHKTIMKRTLLYMSMLAAVLLSCNSNKSAKGSDADDESDVMEVKLKTYSYEQTAKHTEARITIDFPVGGDEELRQASAAAQQALLARLSELENTLPGHSHQSREARAQSSRFPSWMSLKK